MPSSSILIIVIVGLRGGARGEIVLQSRGTGLAIRTLARDGPEQSPGGSGNPNQQIIVDNLAADDGRLQLFASQRQGGGLAYQPGLGFGQSAADLCRVGVDKVAKPSRMVAAAVYRDSI
jgi:hypothetical protein